MRSSMGHKRAPRFGFASAQKTCAAQSRFCRVTKLKDTKIVSLASSLDLLQRVSIVQVAEHD